MHNESRRLLGESDYLPTPEEEEDFISQWSAEYDDRLNDLATGGKWGVYQKYLYSSHWQLLKNQVVERDRFCQHCASGVDLQVHHLIYRGWYQEQLSDLILLCKHCHAKIHSEKNY
ncbi:HNH endonuclease [Microcoleus sp. B5-D4]|uniref:HNH endonuclease n=1 Tax=unclassified Microcoleus TaxID=2642155 RepID=UPI002FD30EF0